MHPVPGTPTRTPAANVNTASSTYATNMYYSISGRPDNGFDAINFTMRPMTDMSDMTGVPLSYYWAMQDTVVGANTFYFGMQPDGEYGKTALFSVFGTGTSSDPDDSYCKNGADGGSGTSCHIPYDWTVGNAYDISVTLIGQSATQSEWEGRITDLATGTSTLIGDIVITSTNGINSNPLAFDEYYSRSYPCSSQPKSEILFYTPTAYFQGKPFPGTISGLNQNGGCNVAFYSDGSTYSYIEAGH